MDSPTDHPATPDHRSTRRSRIPARAWRTLAVTSIVGFMVSLEITVIALAFPAIRQAFPDASESTLSWIITAYNIGVASLLLVAGWAADRFGRKRVFLLGLAVFAVGSLGSGLAPDATLLIVSRVVQAVGGALQFPAGLALLLPAFPFERRQMAIGVWGAMGGLAAALGPPLGGFLVGAFGWPAVFLVNVPIAAGALVAGWFWLEEGRGETLPSRVDLVSIPAASLGVGVLVLAIVQSESWGLGPSTVAAVAIGAALVAVFVVRSRRHPAPLFDLELFRLPSYWLGCVGTVAFVVGFFAFFVPFPTFLQQGWGWSTIRTGLAIVPGPLLAAVVSPPVGRLADRVGNGPILAVGGAAGVTAMGLHLLLTDLQPRLFLGVILPGLFLGVAAGCSFAMSVGATMRDVPPHRFGMAGAGRTTVFQLSVAVAIALAVAVIGDPATGEARLSAMRLSWGLCLAAFAVQAIVFGVFFPRGNPVAPVHGSDAAGAP
ncbi:MAG: MFS transporter [Acidimicrobiales bacterium]